jgi:hypothetical protein
MYDSIKPVGFKLCDRPFPSPSETFFCGRGNPTEKFEGLLKFPGKKSDLKSKISDGRQANRLRHRSLIFLENCGDRRGRIRSEVRLQVTAGTSQRGDVEMFLIAIGSVGRWGRVGSLGSGWS